MFNRIFKDDLDMTNMNRGIEIGNEGSVYVLQPRITPGVLPSVFTHPAAVYLMQPHIAANIFQMQPQIHPENYELQPTHAASIFQMQPVHAASIHQMQPQIAPVVHEMAPEITPNVFEWDDLEDMAQPTYFNRPLPFAPSTFYNREITGTAPRYHDLIIRMGRPTTFNIIPVDPDEQPPTPGPGGPDGPDGTPPPTPGPGGPDGPDGTPPPTPSGEDGWTPY